MNDHTSEATLGIKRRHRELIEGELEEAVAILTTIGKRARKGRIDEETYRDACQATCIVLGYAALLTTEAQGKKNRDLYEKAQCAMKEITGNDYLGIRQKYRNKGDKEHFG